MVKKIVVMVVQDVMDTNVPVIMDINVLQELGRQRWLKK